MKGSEHDKMLKRLGYTLFFVRIIVSCMIVIFYEYVDLNISIICIYIYIYMDYLKTQSVAPIL
jgi:hypothetical protein